MLKKTVAYTNYNGVRRTSEYYFNLNKYELTQMMVGENNISFQNYLQQMVSTNDASEMVRLIKDILLMSYGEKSADGERFVKSDELRKQFEESAAFSELYMELVQDAGNALDFVWGILPPDMRPDQEAMERIKAQNGTDAGEAGAELTIVTDVTD